MAGRPSRRLTSDTGGQLDLFRERERARASKLAEIDCGRHQCLLPIGRSGLLGLPPPRPRRLLRARPAPFYCALAHVAGSVGWQTQIGNCSPFDSVTRRSQHAHAHSSVFDALPPDCRTGRANIAAAITRALILSSSCIVTSARPTQRDRRQQRIQRACVSRFAIALRRACCRSSR